MPTKLQQLRKEQFRKSRAAPKTFRKESDALYYGTLGPASPAKRIDPKTGAVVEIISKRE
jgi:hypothetical protein